MSAVSAIVFGTIAALFALFGLALIGHSPDEHGELVGLIIFAGSVTFHVLLVKKWFDAREGR